jgi:hypothetical protein
MYEAGQCFSDDMLGRINMLLGCWGGRVAAAGGDPTSGGHWHSAGNPTAYRTFPHKHPPVMVDLPSVDGSMADVGE